MKILTGLTSLVLLAFIWGSCESKDQDDQDTVEDPILTDEEIYFEDYLPVLNKWGFIDKAGNVAIEPIFDQVDYFSEAVCAVNYQGKWGYINLNGTWIIEPTYKGAWLFKENRAKIWEFGGKYGFIDIEGNKIGKAEWDEAYNFHYRRAKVKRQDYFGYVDLQGELIIPLGFEYASDFGLQSAKVRQNGKYGIIDTLGNWIIPPEYEIIGDYHNELIRARKNKKYGYINPQNQTIIEFKYGSSLPYHYGIAFVRKDAKWYRLDSQGQEQPIIPCDDIRYAGESRWIYRVRRMFGLMNEKGEAITEPIFQQINNFSEQKACFMKEDLWGYADRNGKTVVPPKYGLCWDFCNDVARVADLRGILFINSTGVEIIQGNYNEVKDFKQNLAPFQEH